MHRILVVDNDPEGLKALSEVAAGQNREIVQANSAASAIEILKRHEFDVVVTDLCMESEDSGLRVLRDALLRDSLMQVIVITAFSNPEINKKVLAGGAFDFLDRLAERTDFLGMLDRKIDLAIRYRPGEILGRQIHYGKVSDLVPDYVVRLTARLSDAFVGSGVLIAPDLVLTCWHVCWRGEPAQRLPNLKIAMKGAPESIRARSDVYDRRRDLMVLRIDVPTNIAPPPWGFPRLTSADRVRVIGFPGGVPYNRERAVEDADDDRVLLRADVRNGISGGVGQVTTHYWYPDWWCVGLVSATLPMSRTGLIAEPLIREFLDAHGLALPSRWSPNRAGRDLRLLGAPDEAAQTTGSSPRAGEDSTLNKETIEFLARTYFTETSAVALCGQAEFAKESLPPWQGPDSFWREVALALDAEMEATGWTRLRQALGKRHPGDPRWTGSE